jgi:hypothetical protein
MHRTLAILKWFPAAICGLLVVAWVVSLAIHCSAQFPLYPGEHGVAIQFVYGTAKLTYQKSQLDTDVWFGWVEQPFHSPSPLGELNYGLAYDGSTHAFYTGTLCVPLLLAISCFLPLAAVLSFRFPLWSYFAWTALIALELAYYLSRGPS